MSDIDAGRTAGSALATPMMQQYLSIKARHPDAILFYRMGDFYEMFLRDAEIAAPLLDIALTTRDRGKPDAVPMCGVPVHAADAHVRRLAELGHRVAICEQVEDPAARGGARRLMRRDVVEVVTPGLVGDPEGLEGARELALACVALPGAGPSSGNVGLAVLDPSTGDLRATTLAVTLNPATPPRLPAALFDEMARIAPRELLFAADADESTVTALAASTPTAACTRVAAQQFEAGATTDAVTALIGDGSDAGTRAARALLGFVATNQPFALRHVARLRLYRLTDSMIVDASTRAHLELFESAEDRSRRGTLIERIDVTQTAPGARRLARWLSYPLLDPVAIAQRQDGVAWLADHDRRRARLRDALRALRDPERLLAKTARPSATPRDLVQLRLSLEALPAVALALHARDDGELSAAAAPRPASVPVPPPVSDVVRLVATALVDDPPPMLRGSRGASDTGFVREGFRSDLDQLRESARKGREWIAGFEAEERERTGIAGLRIRHHPVYGFGIEIAKAQLAKVPSEYERKQTLATAERFTTAELREIERSVAGAHDRAAALEREIFEGVRQAVLGFSDAIRASADAAAEVDALQSLAEVARRDGWVRPEINDGGRIEITAGRHPVVEAQLAASSAGGFVANDTELDPDGAQLWVLTGPNMSGKSTYLRQVAVLVLLAQIGSFLPAERACIGIADRVFTRVGASDRMSRGESTFMVEMREAAAILSQASRRSLVILDEIGRGTSTFDGLSIAWAVAEHLHDVPSLRPRTLFATHYHELTDLAHTKPRARNAHFEAREWGEDVVFLRRLVPGGANRSYGIAVARLAGLPASVIARAKEVLAGLEGDPVGAGRGPARTGMGSPQLALFAGDSSTAACEHTASQSIAPCEDAASEAEQAVLEALRTIDVDRTTPLDALVLLTKWIRALRAGGSRGDA